MKTLDNFVQDALGAQALMICNLQAQLEMAAAKVAELTAARLPPPDPLKEP